MPVMPMRTWAVTATTEDWECGVCVEEKNERVHPLRKHRIPKDEMARLSKRCAEFVMLRGKTSKVPIKNIVPEGIVGELVRRVEIAKDLPRNDAIKFLREATDGLADTGFFLPGVSNKRGGSSGGGDGYLSCGHPSLKIVTTAEFKSTTEGGAKAAMLNHETTWGCKNIRLKAVLA